MAVRTSFIFKESFPEAKFLCDIKSAADKMPPRLSDGCPHSAASQVSLKSSQRIIAPISQAPLTGSKTNFVPGTLTPFGTEVPST